MDLTTPPLLVGLGLGRHGVSRPVDVYQLPDLWAFHLYRYSADLIIDGVLHKLRPGTVSLIPPGAVTEYRYRGPSEHLYAHVRAESVGDHDLRVVNAGRALVALDAHLTTAVTMAATRPERSRAEVWLALLRFTELDDAPSQSAADHVARAVELIEAHLAEPITVPWLAQQVGVSHTHLTRLFRDHNGSTVVGHLRRRRVERAVHLLRNSTLTISAVAASVGVPDLQAFNKMCRQLTGRSPRALRHVTDVHTSDVLT